MAGAYLWGWDDTNSKWVKCIVTAAGKLIINPTGFLENPPTEDEALKAPTSEWAYDHDADASAHHAKYTDAEARASIDNIFDAAGDATKIINMQYNEFTRLYRLNWSRAGYPQNSVKIWGNSAGTELYVGGYTNGVGWHAVTWKQYDGSVYWDVIDQSKFQAELAKYLEETPTNGVINKGPTSNWAYDHDADVSAHHTKYTDAEAVAAFFARKKVLDTGTYTAESMTGISYVDLDPTSGDILLKGLDNGTEGQIIFFVTRSSSYSTIIYYNDAGAAAGDKILTTTKVDITVADYQAFFMIYDGSYWICTFIG